MHGDITIDRGDAASAKKMMEKAGKYLAMGVSVMIFPEGTRSRTGRVDAFKEGAVLMAKRNKADIIPVAHDGTFTAFRGWKFNKNIFRIKILRPISYSEMESRNIKEITASMHEAILNEHKAMRPELYNEE